MYLNDESFKDLFSAEKKKKTHTQKKNNKKNKKKNKKKTQHIRLDNDIYDAELVPSNQFWWKFKR